MSEMIIEAAIIELNRLKSQERMDIDRERLTAAIDVVKDAAQFRIKRKPMPEPEYCYENGCCPNCENVVAPFHVFCPECGQALDWSSL